MPKAKLNKRGDKFGASAVLFRLLLSLFLVFATYNPSGRSYWHWLQSDAPLVPKLLVGVILLAAYTALLVATWEVIGFSGVFLASTICLGFALELGRLAVIDLTDGTTVALVLCCTASAVIAFGMSFSFIFGRLTGIVHTRGVIH